MESSANSSSVQKSSCWQPPSCLKHGVYFLRQHPLVTSAVVFIAVGIFTQALIYSGLPLETKLIIAGATTAGVLLVALPIIFEWRRQNAAWSAYLKEKIKQEEAKENARLNDYIEYLDKNEAAISSHRKLIVDALGGEEKFNALPEFKLHSGHKLSDLKIYAYEMTAPIMRGVISKKVQDRKFDFDFIAIKYRLKDGLEKSIERVIVTYARRLYNETGDEFAWVNTGDGSRLFSIDKDSRFEHYNSYYITPLDGSEAPTLKAIQELALGTHAFCELA